MLDVHTKREWEMDFTPWEVTSSQDIESWAVDREAGGQCYNSEIYRERQRGQHACEKWGICQEMEERLSGKLICIFPAHYKLLK